MAETVAQTYATLQGIGRDYFSLYSVVGGLGPDAVIRALHKYRCDLNASEHRELSEGLEPIRKVIGARELVAFASTP
jgi:hypothetical protein